MTFAMESGTEKIVSAPEITSRGFVYIKEADVLMNGANLVAQGALYACQERRTLDRNRIKAVVRDNLSDYFWKKTQRRPRQYGRRVVRKMRTTIGVVIDTLGSIIIYAVIAAAILFMAGQAKHYYDVGYGVFSQQGKDARGTGKVVAFTVEEGVKAPKLAEQLEEQGIIESARGCPTTRECMSREPTRSHRK